MGEIPSHNDDEMVNDPNIEESWMKSKDFELTPEQQARLDKANEEEKNARIANDPDAQTKYDKGQLHAKGVDSALNPNTEIREDDPKAELARLEERLEIVKAEYEELKRAKKELRVKIKSGKPKLKIYDVA